MDWLSYGYAGLFLASFLAATVLPFSSELGLAAMILAGYDAAWCVAVATAGNTLGGMTSYALGRYGALPLIKKLTRVSQVQIERWQTRIRPYGYWSALFTWTPVAGDVIAIALGTVRANAWIVLIMMGVGKFARYAFIAWFADLF
ncbi:MAG: YqaA family protein [Salibacteraceae bacterium]